MGSFPPQSGRPCRGASFGTFIMGTGLTIRKLVVSILGIFVTSYLKSGLVQGDLHLQPKRPEWSNAHPDMLGHAGVDSPQFGQYNSTVQTAMVRREFDRITMDVLLFSLFLFTLFSVCLLFPRDR